MKNVSSELYKIFWTIGKTGNMTRAAEILCVTQPNVSLAMQSLEKQLGAALFVRTKKGVVLTPEGSILFGEIDSAFNHIEAGEKKLDNLSALNEGSIMISANDTICNHYLLQYIVHFHTEYPNIKLRITNTTSNETIRLIKSGQADIGFINSPVEDDAVLTTKCHDINDVLVCGSKYRELTKTTFGVKNIADYPLIVLEKTSVSRTFLDKYFSSHGLNVLPSFELGSIDAVINFTKYNMGLSFIPEELCGKNIDGKTLFRVNLDKPPETRFIAVVELKNMPLSHAANKFKQFIS